MQGYDRYAYANNDPVTYNDPSGHCIWDLCIVEGIGLVEVLAVVGAAATVAYMETTPQGQEIIDQTAESLANSIQGVTKSTQNKIETLQKIINNPKPSMRHCKGLQAAFVCTVIVVGGVAVGAQMIKKGGCDEPESNLGCPPATPTAAASTVTPTPTDKPQCPPYIECPDGYPRGDSSTATPEAQRRDTSPEERQTQPPSLTPRRR